MLCWLDLETTGLNPDQDIPLEVGIILTDDQLHEIARNSWLCVVENLDLIPTNEFVLNMHTKNGLLSELALKPVEYKSYSEIDSEIVDWIIAWTATDDDIAEQPLYPAGSSVHFDIDFCRKRFPTFARLLHHRHLDVSSVKLFKVACGNPYDPGADDPHRALGDLDNDLAWLRVERMLLQELASKESDERY